MCTILTVDTKTFRQNSKEFIGQIFADSAYNRDGISIIIIDAEIPENNTVFRTMNIDQGVMVLQALVENASEYSRVFVHLRAATTWNTGVGYTHGFDNGNGVFYMHNGVIKNPDQLAVDSFRLISLDMCETGAEMFAALFDAKETFANIFRIDTENYTYSVSRLVTGTLFTDGKGNYSTNAVGSVSVPVVENYFKEYAMEYYGAGLVDDWEDEYHYDRWSV